ncbi:MAG: PKD domain-containing protein, partial [Bacteroidota bacterium]|nr:PKD domain-containing protein [Bacteroidota bacterium]
SVSQGGSKTHVISVPAGTSELRVMVLWVDPQASTLASRALVNDLNMTLTAPNTTVYLPWVLDPTPNAANLNANAVRAVDSLNNMEQVTLDNPAAGNYTVTVAGTSVPTGPQEYYLVYVMENDGIEVTHPIGGESWISGSQNTIRWNAPGNTGNFTIEYSTNGGSTWTTISSSVPGNRRYWSWIAPNLTTGQALVRVSRGSVSAQSQTTFSLMDEPINLAISWACTDSFRLRWDPVQNATGYIIHQLGQMYMDSVDFTVDTGYVFTNQDPLSSEWVSVTALGPNGARSIRAVAVEKLPGNFNCQYPFDLALSTLLSPAPGVHADCAFGSNPQVSVRVNNPGLNNVFGHSIGYRLNGGTPVMVSPGDTISSKSFKDYTFTNTLSVSNNTTYTIEAWVNFSNDGNYLNDTVVSTFRLESGTAVSIPFIETFDNWTTCATGTNCATVCSPGAGWKQQDNGVFDDMDFRTNNGGTPSSGTGPSAGNGGSGNYLYTEASGACTEQLVILNTPCINLGTATSPELSYYYHMSGIAMGDLHTDVVANGRLYPDVVPVISGSQGNAWLKRTVDLSAFAGQTVIIRFRAKTGNDFTSDIAIDDISVLDASVAIPSAGFSAPVAGLCPGDTVVFTSSSTGTITGYFWDFGPNATPPTANTAGPHKVVYSQGGNIPVKLTVSNAGGSDDDNQVLNLPFSPVSLFNYIFTPPATYNFQNNSTGNPSSYLWDFGDGDTSSQASPTHTYASSGQYKVKLITTNNCGTDTLELMVNSFVSIDEMDPFNEARVFPVPTNGDLFLTGLPEHVTHLRYLIHDMAGKELLQGESNTINGEVTIPEVGRLASGSYFLKVTSGNRQSVFRFVVE